MYVVCMYVMSESYTHNRFMAQHHVWACSLRFDWHQKKFRYLAAITMHGQSGGWIDRCLIGGKHVCRRAVI